MMSEEENNKIILDLSKKQLKKVPKIEDAQNVRHLILDDNELHKIDNIDSYLKIEKLSITKNQLLRMYGVCRLHCLRELTLSFNGILSIEGLKDCQHLRHLNLEGNKIKTIEHLNQNTNLEYLNLSENSVGIISDISFLKNLKELYLHGNRLTHLRQCDKYLPVSLETLTLARNNISDLNEICTLSHLCNLNSITISENPCVTMTTGPDGFDYRPFVLNWCMGVKVIDGFMVDPIESLKAEWLYSQGRGRQFRLGEQAALAKYLSSVCPLTGKALENETERKLRLILSKAQQHQRQLQEEISENSATSGNNSPSSNRKKPASRIQSPRFSRLTGRQGSPDSMISSYHGNTTSEQAFNSNYVAPMTTSLIENIKIDSLMMQSFDASTMNNLNSSAITKTTTNIQESAPSRNTTPNHHCNEQSSAANQATGGPLAAASKMVPVPEALMSPDVCPAAVAQRVTVSAINSQIHNSKMNKNKDNKMNSPKTRSPHLIKRHTVRSPTLSPRKINSNNVQSNLSKVVAAPPPPTAMDVQIQMKTRLLSNSVHVSPPHVGSSGGLSSDDDNEDDDDDEEDSDHINVDKLKTIRNKAAQRCQQQQQKENQENCNNAANHRSVQHTESSAVVIQKMWRGYRTRKKTKDIAEKLLKRRTHEYIHKLTEDMEMTKAQLENERKIQQLQMQAINALWKKVSTMQAVASGAPAVTCSNQPSESSSGDLEVSSVVKTVSLDNSSTAVVNDLAKTCTVLTNQVQQLQGSMRDILNCLTLFCNLPHENIKKLLSNSVAEALAVEKKEDSSAATTQTEIVAVHTPQFENQTHFPFNNKIRPSTLPLEMQAAAAATAIEESNEEQDSSLNESGVACESVEKTDEEKPDEEEDVNEVSAEVC